MVKPTEALDTPAEATLTLIETQRVDADSELRDVDVYRVARQIEIALVRTDSLFGATERVSVPLPTPYKGRCNGDGRGIAVLDAPGAAWSRPSH